MDFNTPVNRKNTGALKWDDPENGEGKPDVIPLWVADMDFPVPPAIREALEARTAHPVYGYTHAPADYPSIIQAWYRDRYGAEIEEEDVLIGPGTVPAMAIALRALTSPGSGVLIPSPVYYPFFDIVRDNGRTPVISALVQDDTGRFRLDFADMRRAVDAATASGIMTEAIFFCSPHNPGGRVWTKYELEYLIAFAAELGLAIISDEIHADLIVGDVPFISMSSFAPRADVPVVSIGAPGKSFNLAGLHLNHFVIRDSGVRMLVKKSISAIGYSQPNVFSITAARAAYRECGPWIDELVAYLRGNIDFVMTYLAENIPSVTPYRPEGGYLVWVNAQALVEKGGFGDDGELVRRAAREARVRVNAGSRFGAGGEGFIRINAACPRIQLEEGLTRLKLWIDNL